jgi:hypothetical protein
MDLKKSFVSVRRGAHVTVHYFHRCCDTHETSQPYKVHVHKHMSDTFRMQNGLKQGRCSMATAFQLCCRICYQEGQENRMGGWN